jgi:hypothetical protein
MKRFITFSAAYDKQHKDPNKNYGIHGVDMRMVLQGELGAMSFTLFTNWYLPETQA